MSGYEIIVRRRDGSPPVTHEVSELEVFAIGYAIGVARRGAFDDAVPLLGDATRPVAKELVLSARNALQRLGLLEP